MNRWVSFGFIAVGVLLLAIAIVWLVAISRYRTRMSEAEVAWGDIAVRSAADLPVFSPEMVVGLPEIARRYFTHAIASGTRISTVVELKMTGSFLLGEMGKTQSYKMDARQILAPPQEFVWIAKMVNSPVTINGTDGLWQQHGWTRFWMYQSIPLVQIAATKDLDRSAAMRPALEAIWAPASLLPMNDVFWEQIGPDTAHITFGAAADAHSIDMKLAADGRVIWVSAMRWSDANAVKTFQLQPFGAETGAEATFDGYTIPSIVHAGNHFGTDTYFPFFNAQINDAKFR